MSTKAVFAAAAIALAAVPALAGTIGTYTFHRITSNVAGNAVTDQIRMDLIDTGNAGEVQFKFYFENFVTSMVMAKAYWDDNASLLTSTGSTTASSNTTSHHITYQSATPGTFPAGNTVGFVESRMMEARNPIPGNGIRAGTDYVTFQFSLPSGKTADDVKAALATGGTDSGSRVADGMRVGLHIISIGGGSSDSYVNDGLRVVPLPGTAGLACVGTLGILGSRRRRTFA